MSPINRLSLSNTSNTKRSIESIELPESVDNKRRRLALSFFKFMENHIEEGVVTPGEIMQFCNRYNESGTHQEMGEEDFEMPGLQYDVDVRDYNDSGAEEQDVGAEEHELPTHEDFHPGMDLRNGIRDSFSPAPNVNPSPSIPGSDSALSSCATPSPWITPVEFDTPSYHVDPRELANTLSERFAGSAESLSGDSSDDSQGGLNQKMLESDPAGDMEGSAAENQDEEVMEEEEDDEYEEEEDDEYEEEEDDELMESEDEDWKTAEEEDGDDEQEGEGFNESEVTSSRMAAELAEPVEPALTLPTSSGMAADCLDGRREGDSEKHNEKPPQVRTLIPRGERDPQLFNIDLIPAIWPEEFREDIGADDDDCFEVPGKPAPPPEEYVIKDSDDESTKAKKIMYVSLPCFPIV